MVYDPIPFSNFAGAPFAGHGVCLDEEWKIMKSHLERFFGCSAALEREMVYRRVLSNRTLLAVAFRYLDFRTRYSPIADEWLAVRQLILSIVGVRELNAIPEVTV